MKIWLKNFRDLDAKEVVLVLEWRNHKNVAPFMRHKVVTLQEHLCFLESLKKDSTKEYFLVFKDAIPIGVIDFVEISLQSCAFGLYQNPSLSGFGSILMQEVLEYAFKILKVKELKACVFKNNTKALELYLKFGFTITKENATMYNVSLCAGGGA
ncbi:UDP-4-amino-4,6-dideoxy-N-acetyl-beta-L-altrosamine N-acetyltransferase [Helicobacter sp.]|uniref:UDP-4-amino-4, 6-dideoxy-N-acetyl-beta-L-altrosamine N-acetyltransferase n=1 Tax=Helicobacter sp. TaxID=218 RepID=UPI002A766706|nr:UDP-4-amino-4,6-dideoxy-N-acetyl-beta-L-altrosamine N-acetyltransferase [Helicobacter sp.]MDY2585585.1 UDP-4-amino-4,6-dideoxy-N-acetyl-beta-L-altrosamine N-acetyltransferase [Helicobacter sp.]